MIVPRPTSDLSETITTFESILFICLYNSRYPLLNIYPASRNSIRGGTSREIGALGRKLRSHEMKEGRIWEMGGGEGWDLQGLYVPSITMKE
jgi:hypothetical protein